MRCLKYWRFHCVELLLENGILSAMIEVFNMHKNILDNDEEFDDAMDGFIRRDIETLLFNLCTNDSEQCYLDAIYVPKLLQL